MEDTEWQAAFQWLSDEMDKFFDPSIFEMFKYRGYNPKEMADTILDIGGENAQTDIQQMIELSIKKGHFIDRIIKRSRPKISDTIKNLQARYKLVNRCKNNPSAVTLSRVVLSFPLVACGYLFEFPNMSTFVYSEKLPVDYPAVMKTFAFAHMIPNYKSYTQTIINAFTLHQLEYKKVFSKKSTTHKELVSDVERHVNSGVNSDFIPNKEREEYMIKWQIIKDGSVSQAVLNAEAELKKRLSR